MRILSRKQIVMGRLAKAARKPVLGHHRPVLTPEVMLTSCLQFFKDGQKLDFLTEAHIVKGIAKQQTGRVVNDEFETREVEIDEVRFIMEGASYAYGKMYDDFKQFFDTFYPYKKVNIVERPRMSGWGEAVADGHSDAAAVLVYNGTITGRRTSFNPPYWDILEKAERKPRAELYQEWPVDYSEAEKRIIASDPSLVSDQKNVYKPRPYTTREAALMQNLIDVTTVGDKYRIWCCPKTGIEYQENVPMTEPYWANPKGRFVPGRRGRIPYDQD